MHSCPLYTCPRTYPQILCQEVAVLYAKNPDMRAFLIFAGFTWLFWAFIIGFTNSIPGLLFLIRLIAYFYTFVVSYIWVSKDIGLRRNLLLNSLFGILVLTAIFGWLQYVYIPDVRWLFVWGWDDHLYRLVGTFLDPGFMSLFMAFGGIMAMDKYSKEKKKVYIFLFLFFLMTLAFTYSRAGFIALFAGLFYFFSKGKLRLFSFIFVLFILIVLLLPRPSSEGVKLERSFSISLRLNNYIDTIQTFTKSPLFGVGYNNLCFEKKKTWSLTYPSHSCSGSDASLLTVLVTTGVPGLIIYLNLLKEIYVNTLKTKMGKAYVSLLVALLVHSIFNNSLFYSWVIIFMFLFLGAILVKEKK